MSLSETDGSTRASRSAGRLTGKFSGTSGHPSEYSSECDRYKLKVRKDMCGITTENTLYWRRRQASGLGTSLRTAHTLSHKHNEPLTAWEAEIVDDKDGAQSM